MRATQRSSNRRKIRARTRFRSTIHPPVTPGSSPRTHAQFGHVDVMVQRFRSRKRSPRIPVTHRYHVSTRPSRPPGSTHAATRDCCPDVTTWHWVMIAGVAVTLYAYAGYPICCSSSCGGSAGNHHSSRRSRRRGRAFPSRSRHTTRSAPCVPCSTDSCTSTIQPSCARSSSCRTGRPTVRTPSWPSTPTWGSSCCATTLEWGRRRSRTSR